MIKAKIFEDCGFITGFEVENHGKPIICAAISILVLNTVNSIETFTIAKFICDPDEEEGGLLSFRLVDRPGAHSNDVNLLLKSLKLGLQGIADEHPNDLKLKIIKLKKI